MDIEKIQRKQEEEIYKQRYPMMNILRKAILPILLLCIILPPLFYFGLFHFFAAQHGDIVKLFFGAYIVKNVVKYIIGLVALIIFVRIMCDLRIMKQ
ncbi:MAG: hypothetical protein K6A44_03385 [bacterium]|nr:hypothetical protein [bacterium]